MIRGRGTNRRQLLKRAGAIGAAGASVLLGGGDGDDGGLDVIHVGAVEPFSGVYANLEGAELAAANSRCSRSPGSSPSSRQSSFWTSRTRDLPVHRPRRRGHHHGAERGEYHYPLVEQNVVMAMEVSDRHYFIDQGGSLTN